jgi:hypothetical protein
MVGDALPKESRILIPRGGYGMTILATWALRSEQFRPRKRSRMIRIVLSEEALSHYASGSEVARAAGDARFVAWLKQQLQGFDPNHESPLGVEPPPVTWNFPL